MILWSGFIWVIDNSIHSAKYNTIRSFKIAQLGTIQSWVIAYII